MTMDRALEYEIFISYCRRDNEPDGHGWVTALCDQIQQDHRRFSTEPLRIFFDKQHIADMDDWRHRILGGLRSSQILLVCLSPEYFHSDYCRWEWEEYGRRHIHQLIGHEGIAPVYFVEVPGSDEQQNAAEFQRWVQSIRPWMDDVMAKNFTDIRPWFPAGVRALHEAEVQRRMAKLGESLWQRIQRARRAAAAQGNLRRQSPYFVGRRKELHQLHQELSGGRVGVVTAVHGLGGQGKTELAVAYGHGFADWYPAGLWVLGAEGKTDLLSLIGDLAFVPELGLTPTEAQKADPQRLGRAVLAELQRRSEAASADRQPGQSAAALLILDNVSEASLLSSAQLATLPQTTWLQVVATTRLDPARLPTAGRNLARVAVDSLLEEDALALVRDHQHDERFASPADEAAARQIVRMLDGFTLAVEQVAVYLGVYSSVTPAALLASLQGKGLTHADQLARRLDDAGQGERMLHQQKQLGVILDATLSQLDSPARTALELAAWLPPDTVPWPWLRELTLERHPHLAQFEPDEPDPWLEVRRRLEGLRLLTGGDQPQIARIHRLVSAHMRQRLASGDGQGLSRSIHDLLVRQAWAVYRATSAPKAWELDALLAALPPRLGEEPASQRLADLAEAATFASNKIVAYRTLTDAKALLDEAHRSHQRLAAADPGNAGWQRDLSVSHTKLGDVLSAQGDLSAALSSYRASLAIRERLAAADPGNAGWQRDLSVSHNKLGDVLSAQGDLSAALSSYRASLAISERLAAADPGNAGWQRDVWVSCWRVASVTEQTGGEARAWWRRAYEVLSAMKERGLFVSANDERCLAQLEEKIRG